MPSLATFVRKAPMHLLRQFFVVNDIDLPGDLTWQEKTTTPVFKAIEKLDHVLHEQVANTFGRIAELSDDAGQNALLSVIKERSSIANLPNGHARAFWVYLYEFETFRRAEEVRYTDHRRRGKQWDGFLSGLDLELKRDDETIESFKAAVREKFSSPNVHVDLFDRHRQHHGKGEIALVQATVYLEGRADQALEFVDGELDLRDHQRVVEASLTYEPVSGSIEVVAGDHRTREDFARLFARTVLGAEFTGEHLPLRQFQIDKLRRPFDFRWSGRNSAHVFNDLRIRTRSGSVQRSREKRRRENRKRPTNGDSSPEAGCRTARFLGVFSRALASGECSTGWKWRSKGAKENALHRQRPRRRTRTSVCRERSLRRHREPVAKRVFNGAVRPRDWMPR